MDMKLSMDDGESNIINQTTTPVILTVNMTLMTTVRLVTWLPMKHPEYRDWSRPECLALIRARRGRHI